MKSLVLVILFQCFMISESSYLDIIQDEKEIESAAYGQKQTKDDGAGFAAGNVSVDCLRCICLHDSNCQDRPCRVFDGALYCGYFLISSDHWLDCGSLGGDWKSCTHNVTCASECIQRYVAYYAPKYNCPLHCEGYARQHKGGPNGCNLPSTLAYWMSVKAQPGCNGVF